MITCTRTANGGRIIVDETHGHSTVEFWLSDTTSTPLSLRIQETIGSTARLTLSVANSLAERYGSPVVWLETANAELRYTPTLGNGLRATLLTATDRCTQNLLTTANCSAGFIRLQKQ